MANHKSAIKRAKQNEIRRLRNRSVKTRVKNIIKTVRAAVSEKDPNAASEALIAAQSTIDRAAKKGVIHKRAASRRISRLTHQVESLKKGMEA